MEIRTIRNIDNETWRKFKNLAEKNNINMGNLLKIMINNFKKNSEEFWEEILNEEKNLSNQEAEKILEISKKSRKEYGFRR